MRIGIDARAVGVYPGLGRYAFELLRELVPLAEGHHLVVFLSPQAWTSGAAATLGAFPQVKVLRCKVPLLSPLNVGYFPRVVDSFGFDLFHCLFQAAPRLRRTPMVTTVHDMMDLNYPPAFDHHPQWKQVLLRAYFSRLVPEALRRSASLIHVSRATLDDAVALFPEVKSKSVVLHEAASEGFHATWSGEELREMRERLGLPPVYLLYLGSTKRYKNIELLITAYQQYADSCSQSQQPSTPLVVAGMKRVRDISTPISGGSVHILEAISEEDLPKLLASAKIFLLPSAKEGFGLPALEAMAAGTPTVVSDTAALVEVAGRGAVISPQTAEDMAHILLDLEGHPEKLRALSAKARKRAQEFSWKTAAARTWTLYRDTLGLSQSPKASQDKEMLPSDGV